MADGVTKCEEDDPSRCQGLSHHGQCPNIAVPGSKYCRVHAGAACSPAKQAAHNYQLTVFQARMERMADSDIIKSLRDEIGLLRMILETQLNRCKDDTDLLLSSQTIGDLIMKIERLVISSSKLDRELGRVVDRQAILSFATQVISIIADNVDADLTAKIATAILAAIETGPNDLGTCNSNGDANV